MVLLKSVLFALRVLVPVSFVALVAYVFLGFSLFTGSILTYAGLATAFFFLVLVGIWRYY